MDLNSGVIRCNMTFGQAIFRKLYETNLAIDDRTFGVVDSDFTPLTHNVLCPEL